MRSLMLAMFCGAALFFFAPQAAASDQAPQEPAVIDEAPVDLEAEQLFCPRRMGGPSARRTARRCAPAVISDSPSFGATTCAVRYAYRGHRRINYRPRRMGGPSARRTARRCAPTTISDSPSFGATSCAVRYAYRGHRRINYRPRSCEPLFQRGATSAI